MSNIEDENSQEEKKNKRSKKKQSKNKEKPDECAKDDNTILTPAHGSVPKSHYKYYALEKNLELEDLVERYVPTDDEIFIFKGTPKCHRMIYPVNDDGYEEDEEEHYQEFMEYLKENDFQHFDMFRKREFMRILEGMDWKMKEGLAETLLNVEFKQKLPVILDDKMIKCLESGLYYCHGRDRNLRPIMIFCPKVVVTQNIELEDAIITTHFVSQYIIDHLMYEGKVENYLTILDSAKLSITALPKINVCMAILNVHWTIRAIYAIVKPFIHPTTRQKIIFESNNTCDALISRVDPCQLEQKYGGQAEDLTHFWPPQTDSNEYGIDESRLKRKTKKSKKSKQSKKEGDGGYDGVKAENIRIEINEEVDAPHPEEESNQNATPQKTHTVKPNKGCGCSCSIF